MKLYIIIWSISGHIRIVGSYKDYELAENKIIEMQKSNIQGYYKIHETIIEDENHS